MLLSFKRGSHNVRSGICDESDPQSTFDAFNIKINLYNAAQEENNSEYRKPSVKYHLSFILILSSDC
jgi:hypothetical protein